jgi:long-chain acyl-CoA synthetase
MSFDPDLYRRTVRLEGRGQDGGSLNMSVIDAGPRDALRTIVFLHGMGGYAGYWHHQCNHFYESSRVIVPDLRGHGMTDAPTSNYSRDELLTDIEGVIAALGLPARFILVTHSFGGALGTLYTHRHPERVEKLVIIGSAVRFDKLKNAGRFLLRLPRWLVRLALSVLPQGKRYPPGHVVHAQYRNAVITYDGTPFLKAITCPTLVILGQRDRLFDTSAYQAIAKLIPGAQEVTLPQSAHQVMVERPDAVNRALDRFLGPVQLDAEEKLRRQHDHALEIERPWLKFYDGRTPYQIRPPQAPVQRTLEIAARRFADVTALQFHRRGISYRQLDRLANRFADGLRKQGVRPGSRVLIALPSIPQAVIAYFATLKLGGVVVFMEPRADSASICSRVAQVRAEVVLVLSSRYADLRASVPAAGARCLVFTTIREYMGVRDWLAFTFSHHHADGHGMSFLSPWATPRTLFRFEDLLSLKTDRPDSEPAVDDPAIITYTGGTGDTPPKPVCLSHRNLTANALQIRHWVPELRPGDERIVAVGTLAAGFALPFNLAPMVGATVVLVPRFDPLEILRSIKLHKPTLMTGSPRLYQLMSRVPEVRSYGVANVRVCLSTGSTLPVEVQESFEKLTKGRVINVYVTTEAGLCLAEPLAARKRGGSVGVPLPDVEVRLLRPGTDIPCDDDETGEMWVRGPQVSAGDGQPSHPAPPIPSHGWFFTGDLARRDADGFFYLVAREEDVIRHGPGDKVPDSYPSAIEEVLYELPEVSEAAVTSWTNAQGALEIVAFIVPRTAAPLDRAHLHQWCQGRLPVESRPTRYEAIDRVPRSRTGKILRRDLRDRYR